MDLGTIKGLKYPDDYFIKFFFKMSFHKKKNLKFIEFGSSNGNNLTLPYQYGHHVTGIDIDKKSIDDAFFNFQTIYNNNQSSFNFYLLDMLEFAQTNNGLKADVFMLPNIVNYISREDFYLFLKFMKENGNLKQNASIFIRCRTPKDFRFGLGIQKGYNAYKFEESNNITGEAGCLNTFYNELDITDTLREHLNLRDFTILQCDFQNIQNNTIVSNSDLILWGTIL